MDAASRDTCPVTVDQHRDTAGGGSTGSQPKDHYKTRFLLATDLSSVIIEHVRSPRQTGMQTEQQSCSGSSSNSPCKIYSGHRLADLGRKFAEETLTDQILHSFVPSYIWPRL